MWNSIFIISNIYAMCAVKQKKKKKASITRRFFQPTQWHTQYIYRAVEETHKVILFYILTKARRFASHSLQNDFFLFLSYTLMLCCNRIYLISDNNKIGKWETEENWVFLVSLFVERLMRSTKDFTQSLPRNVIKISHLMFIHTIHLQHLSTKLERKKQLRDKRKITIVVKI